LLLHLYKVQHSQRLFRLNLKDNGFFLHEEMKEYGYLHYTNFGKIY
jgi:hypothetical protein